MSLFIKKETEYFSEIKNNFNAKYQEQFCDTQVKVEQNEVKSESELLSFNIFINLPNPEVEAKNELPSEIPRKFICDLCNHETKEKYQMSSHMRKNHVYKKLGCAFCERSFKNLHSLYCHKQIHENPKIKCEICEKIIKRTSFKEHLNEVHATGLNFHCLICNQFYKTKKTLKRHQKIHNKKYECKICHHKFARGDVLNKHLKVHSKPESAFKKCKMITSRSRFNKFRANFYDERIINYCEK
jgi:hypothetical protein